MHLSVAFKEDGGKLYIDCCALLLFNLVMLKAKDPGLKRNTAVSKSRRRPALIIIAIFALIGAYYFVSSQAAVTSKSIEVESGNVVNPAASYGNSSTASGSSAVKFNAGSGPPPTGDTVVIAAAGDIATTGSTDGEVANRINADSAIKGVLALGDIAYQNATNAELANYQNTWGIFKSKTYPAIGNHEYYADTSKTGHLAQPYTDYWRSEGQWTSTALAPSVVRQITVDKQWYSFNLGSWHLISLDSEKNIPAQTTWLQQDLAANSTACTIAYWHSPYWAGSGSGVSISRVKPFMDALLAAKADIVLAGHEHAYNRFPKMNSSSVQTSTGIRTWVVGTGGTGLATSGDKSPLNEMYLDGGSGLRGAFLRLELKPASYNWQLIDTTGAVKDSGSDTCVQ